MDELFIILTPGNVDWKPKLKKASEYGPRESLTIIGKVASYQGVENCIRAFTPGEVEVIGPDDAWREIILRYPNGTKVTFCSLERFKDGDHSSQIRYGLICKARQASTSDQELKTRVQDQCRAAVWSQCRGTQPLRRVQRESEPALVTVVAAPRLPAKLSPAQSTYVENILNAGDHLLALVNQVIDMSRIEAGDVEMRIDDVRVAEVVASSVAMVELAADKRGIAISPCTVMTYGKE